MKFLVSVLMLGSISGYCMTEKTPEKVDISVKNIIGRTCLMSGYFNQLACEEEMLKCYNEHSWPKTVSVEMKIDVVVGCTYSVITR